MGKLRIKKKVQSVWFVVRCEECGEWTDLGAKFFSDGTVSFQSWCDCGHATGGNVSVRTFEKMFQLDDSHEESEKAQEAG